MQFSFKHNSIRNYTYKEWKDRFCSDATKERKLNEIIEKWKVIAIYYGANHNFPFLTIGRKIDCRILYTEDHHYVEVLIIDFPQI